jgi:hypothetical protein
MLPRITTLTVAGVLLLTPGLEAQFERYETPQFTVGVDFVAGDPVGDFSDFVNEGFGGEFMGRIALDPYGRVSLRADLGFLIYGYESFDVCMPGVGCRVGAELQTTNSIFYGGIGPELAIPLPFARPYVNTFMGFGYFSTTSSMEEDWGWEDYFHTENFGDGTFAWGVGWGVEFNVSSGRVPIAINLGGRYHDYGVVKYLTEGDIVDHPDGSITLFPILSEASLISYRIGVTVGIPRPGSDDHDDKIGRRHW